MLERIVEFVGVAVLLVAFVWATSAALIHIATKPDRDRNGDDWRPWW